MGLAAAGAGGRSCELISDNESVNDISSYWNDKERCLLLSSMDRWIVRVGADVLMQAGEPREALETSEKNGTTCVFVVSLIGGSFYQIVQCAYKMP